MRAGKSTFERVLLIRLALLQHLGYHFFRMIHAFASFDCPVS
jgi:hypothetical protein